VKKELKKIGTSDEVLAKKSPTLSKELNNLLGGGITQGSVILLSGEPGIGKSTLSLQLANWYDGEIIYIS
jgi:DNA repair protein RadA/Sms